MSYTEQIVCEKRMWEEKKLIHTHDFGHLLFPLKGELSIQTRNQAAVMNDQKLIFLPPGCQHIFSSRKGWTECLVVDIPVFLAPYLPKSNGNDGKLLDINNDWQALRTLILSESAKEYPSLNHLLYYSFRLLQEDREPVSIQYLKTHCFEQVSIEMLAELEHYNVSYYSQWFQKKMHMTPQQYIRLLRLNEAKRLLRETGYSLAYIAQAVGYSHQSYLTKLFKEMENITPLVYRINNRDKNR